MKIEVEWVKTKDKKPDAHEIIIFMDKYNNFHYGVFCSKLSEKSKRNKYWCHIFNQSYNKNDIVLWMRVPEKEAFELLYSSIEHAQLATVQNAMLDLLIKTEEAILKDAKERDYEKYPGALVRNALFLFANNFLCMPKDQ